MLPTKACPVVLRDRDGIEILAFRHPFAGIQLVKGTIEIGESPEAAAVRELAEEAGLVNAKVVSHFGVWDSKHEGQIWSLHHCEVAREIPDEWIHHTSDDGGHDFAFFWHPLSQPGDEQWHKLFQDALVFIRATVMPQ